MATVADPSVAGHLRYPPPPINPLKSRATEYERLVGEGPTEEGALRPGLRFDWSATPPDGSDAAMAVVQTYLSQHFDGNVAIGTFFQSETPRQYPAVLKGKNTPHDQALHSALLEAAYTTNGCLYSTSKGQTSAVLKRLGELGSAHLLLGFGVAVADNDGCALGVVVQITEQGKLRNQTWYSSNIENVRQELTEWLRVWRLARAGAKLQRWRDTLHLWTRNRLRLTLASSAVAATLLATPFPFRPQRPSVVEPAARAYISSPIDGNLLDSPTRPGDVVVKGQILARIEDTQIRWNLATAQSELEAATKRYDSALASRSGGDLRLAQLEQEQIQLKIDSLNHQLRQLELTCPIDGVIVQGDWQQKVGAPLKRGENLYEIAPLDSMRIETHLKSEDLLWAEPGMMVSFHFDSASNQLYRGTIERIDPRGQVIDAEVVFVAEVQLANPDHAMRPGMRGTGRLSAGWRSVGWLLFSRPYTWVMKWLVW